MSNQIKTKLTEVSTKLEEIRNAVLAGKRQIAYAIAFNGISNVHPYDTNDDIYDTFTRYAELIRRLKSANAMVLQYTIPEENWTAYKRTVVVPMTFSNTSYKNQSLDYIAQEIINNDTSSAPAAHSAAKSSKKKAASVSDNINDYILTDPYGNECLSPDYVLSVDDIQNYLTPEQQKELFDAIEKTDDYIVYETNTTVDDELLNAPTTMDDNTVYGDSEGSEDGISAENLDDAFSVDPQAEGEAVANPNATYNYTVDWGDGSDVCTYTDGADYEINKAAIWHTYAEPGTYQVSINGNFRKIWSNPWGWSNLVVGGEYIKDKDGKNVLGNQNYASTNMLVEVIAWGNTLLTDMQYAFYGCSKLANIPMYDTTNSFADVTTFTHAFHNCTALKNIPFNSGTNRGLFSGCKKVTDFSYTFASCTGMTGSIPVKLIDGCTNVENVSCMFSNAHFTGGIPNGILSGMTKLKNASEMFAGCSLSGPISTDLFKDCPHITNIARLFYNCSGITGEIAQDFIGNLSELTDMRQAFFGCSGITGFNASAFWNLNADGINCCDAFKGCTGITSIPKGLLNGLRGKNLKLERMFDNCTGITSVPQDALVGLRVANARGMFGGCTSLSKILNESDNEVDLTPNTDWDTFSSIEKWYGIFSKTGLVSKFCAELGGTLARKFTAYNVGKIVLRDGTMVEPSAYTAPTEDKKKPIGVVYKELWYKKDDTTASIANGAGNATVPEAEGADHKTLVMVLNDTTRTWVSEQRFTEDVTTIANTYDVNVSYSQYAYDASGKQTLTPTRYCGDVYSKALLKFIFEKGYASNIVTGTYTQYSFVTAIPTIDKSSETTIYYMINNETSNKADYIAYIKKNNSINRDASLDVYLNKITSDRYPAITYCNGYKVFESGTDLVTNICYHGDASDYWDMFVQKHMIQTACDAIVAGGTHTDGVCKAIADGSIYWSAAEYDGSRAWSCSTYDAYVYNYSTEWGRFYVRPVFALADVPSAS